MKNELSDSFETLIGSLSETSSHQSFSLAAVLSSILENSNRSNPPVSSLGLPLEMEYTDDVDFLDEEKKPLDDLQSVAP